MDAPLDQATRLRAIAAAQGQAPFDRLLTAGTVLDVATRYMDLGEALLPLINPKTLFVARKGISGLVLSGCCVLDLSDLGTE